MHEITIDGKTLRYKATVGRIPIKNAKTTEIEAQVFCTYYALETDTPVEQRPLTFAFNGGPGSASVWVHMGALGPKRVALNDDGSLPLAPYKLVENPHTWLPETDLLFIDPVGTGFSRAKDDETGKKFWGVEGDIDGMYEFCRLFLTRYNRWASPLYLAGESYGTTRSAAMAAHFVDHGIAFVGIILISTVLTFQTIRFTQGNDLPFALYLPTYAATARYHKKLAPELMAQDFDGLLNEVRAFATGEYTLALTQGTSMPDDQFDAIVAKVARYTGLSERYVRQRNLRIEHWRFCKELLRDEGIIVGRFDSRLTAKDANNAAESTVVRRERRGDSPAVHQHVQRLHPPHAEVRDRSLLRRFRRCRRVEVGQWRLHRQGTGARDRARQKPPHARSRHLRLLRSRDPLRGGGVYSVAHADGPQPAAEHRVHVLPGGAHDVH